MQSNGSPGMSREIEMGMAQMEQIKSAVESINMQKESLRSIVAEYDRSIEVMEALKEGRSGEIMVPAGGLVMLKMDLKKDARPFVDRGMGVMMETDVEEAIGIITDRKGKVSSSIETLDSRIKELMGRYEDLSKRTQELYREQMVSGNGPEKTF